MPSTELSVESWLAAAIDLLQPLTMDKTEGRRFYLENYRLRVASALQEGADCRPTVVREHNARMARFLTINEAAILSNSPELNLKTPIGN